MSERPTKLEVDLALKLAYPGSQAGPNTATVLGVEVRALREEVKFASARADDNEATVRRLMATIARVEKLPDKWLDDVAYQRESVADCAYDVEQALRGER